MWLKTGPWCEAWNSPVLLIEDQGPDEVGRQKVRGELDALEVDVQRARQGLDRQRLGQPGHALDQHMAAGQEADQQAVDQVVLADDHLADLLLHLLEGQGLALDFTDRRRSFGFGHHLFCLHNGVCGRTPTIRGRGYSGGVCKADAMRLSAFEADKPVDSCTRSADTPAAGAEGRHNGVSKPSLRDPTNKLSGLDVESGAGALALSPIDTKSRRRQEVTMTRREATPNPGQQLLIKVALVLFVCPMIVQLNLAIFGTGLIPLLYVVPADWAEAVGIGIRVVALALGLLTGGLVLWKFWPRTVAAAAPPAR